MCSNPHTKDSAELVHRVAVDLSSYKTPALEQLLVTDQKYIKVLIGIVN